MRQDSVKKNHETRYPSYLKPKFTIYPKKEK